MAKVQIDPADIERRLKALMVDVGEPEETADRFLPMILEDMESGKLSEADFSAGLKLMRVTGIRPKGSA